MLKSRVCKISESETLSAYADGMLDGQSLRRLTRHIERCADCRRTLDEQARMVAILRGVRLDAPSPQASFWSDAYRTARLSGEPPTTAVVARQVFVRPVRRRLASLAAIGIATIALSLVPTGAMRGVLTQPADAAQAIDVSALVKAHASGTSDEPLVDHQRIAMVVSDIAAQQAAGAGEDGYDATGGGLRMEVPSPTRRIAARTTVLIAALALAAGRSVAAAPPKKAPTVHKAPSAASLYRRSLTVDSDFAYTGREYFTEWRFDDRTYASVEDIAHRPPSSDLTTYIAPLGSKGRMVLQKGSQFWTFIPDRHLIVRTFEPSGLALPQQNAQFKLLVSNYALTVSPKPTIIAGRKVFEVSIRPRASGRPYVLLWIDPVTGVVMRREDYHSDGALASVSYFGQIKFHPKFRPGEFSPQQWNGDAPRVVDQPMRAEAPVSPSAPPRQFAGKAVFPPSVDGFALQRATLLSGGHAKILHLIYSDGLNPLSLYEGLRRGRGPTRVPGSRRVVLAPGVFGRTVHQYAYVLLTWDSGPLYYTLVSDLSLANLIRVADATGTIRPSPAKAAHR